MRHKLTDAQVTAIRTSGLTDAWWGRRLRLDDNTIRNARTGSTYRHVSTPPDNTPREGTGTTHAMRSGLPVKARMARARRSYFNV